MALRDGRLAMNPLARVERTREPKSKVEHWTPEEARAFLQSQHGDRLYPLWFFWLSIGLRPGEIVPLRWSNVDPDVGRVAVREFVSVVDYQLVESDGKTKGAHRVIDIDPCTRWKGGDFLAKDIPIKVVIIDNDRLSEQIAGRTLSVLDGEVRPELSCRPRCGGLRVRLPS